MIHWDFTNKHALIIGGSRGIGAAMVDLIAEAGGHVAWTGRKANADDEPRPNTQAIALDCTDEKATHEAVDRLNNQWGRIDYLIYNAGFSSPVSLMDVTATQWRKTMDINLTGAFIAAHAVMPHMLEHATGAIVFIGSGAVFTGGGGRADYCSAKAGLEGLSRSIAKEMAHANIRSNVVHPSLIDTDLLRQRHPEPAKRETLAQQVPLRRLGCPDEIASAAAFLLSDEAGYITGQSLLVDGGRTFYR